jgi:hypothetical protein
MKMNVERKRGRGRPKKRWLEMIKNDMKAIGACIGLLKIETSGSLEQRSPTPNSWEKGEGEEEK